MNARILVWMGVIFALFCMIIGCQSSVAVKNDTNTQEAAKEKENKTDKAADAKDQKEEANTELTEQEDKEIQNKKENTAELAKQKDKEIKDKKENIELAEGKNKNTVSIEEKEDKINSEIKAEDKEAQDKLNNLVEQNLNIKEKEKAFVAHLIKTAKKKIANYEYKAADKYLNEALALDQENHEAKKLKKLISTFSGEASLSPTSLNKMYEKEIKVKIEQAKLEIRNHYNNGMQALKNKRFDQAIEEFESALDIIKWNPYRLGLSSLKQRAKQRIKEVKEAKKIWQIKQRRKQMLQAQKDAELLEREAQAQRTQKIQILLARATEFYTQKKFDKAKLITRQILTMDHTNKIAKRLDKDISDAQHSYIAEKTLELKIDEWQNFLKDIRESAIPINDVIIYPDKDYWHNVVSKRRKTSDFQNRSKEKESKAVNEIKTKLNSKSISFAFSNVPFEDVINYIQKEANINIVLDPDVLQKFKINAESVTLQLKDVKLQDALNILLQFHNLTYIFKNDVLFITFINSKLARGKPIPVLHDIRDLTVKIRDFPGPKIKLSTTRDEISGGATFKESQSPTTVALTGEKITELIKASIKPDSWEKEGYSIAQTSGQLLVVHTKEVQTEISKFLSDLRKYSGMLVTIQARFLEITDDFLEHLGVDWRGIGKNNLKENDPDDDSDDEKVVMPALTQGNSDFAGGSSDNTPIDTENQSVSPSSGAFFRDRKGNFDMRSRTEHIDTQSLGTRLKRTGGLSVQFAALDDTELNAVIWMIKKTGRAKVLMAPRLTAFNTQRANITVVEQNSYIKDFDVQVAQAAYIADPIIGTIQSGVVLDVRPTISNDRKYITLELRPTVASLREFRPFSTTLGAKDKTVEFEVPILELQSVETTVRIPDQGTILLGGLKSANNIDRKLDIPILGNIPIISFFFSQRSKVDEKQDLVILVNAKIIDLEEEEEKAVGSRR